MVKWTNEQPQIATEADCKARWSGGTNGKYFRCYLCGHQFEPGDQWRFVFGRGTINFMICAECDGPDVLEKWKNQLQEAKTRFWWLRPGE